jgi:TetR/AcrR family transcriptional repressor of nem operon
MRYSEDHKQATHAKVLKAASRVIRENGPDRIAVAGIMAEVGLTHGGFYAHFASKDDLLVEAIGQMFVEARDNFEVRTANLPPSEALASYLDFYLSTSHRDRRDRGCPLPALAADLPRLPAKSRKSYGQGVAGLTGQIARLLEACGLSNPQTLASSVLSQMVGAVALARAVSDAEQSDAILSAARESIRARVAL